ncbi:MAG TPA: ribosome biogenesis GTPase Der [Candidatus Acidoferrum sp.]|nr:ribosome biogenesis GTPase Der [Candidatus Acidoferrum sp.]
MVPVIALVGRPNVGKSTLFNCFTQSRDALVADYAGLTRDRLYGEGRFGERRFIVIDTGGINGGEEGIDQLMVGQSLQAIEEADLVMLLVDGRAGLTPGDEFIVQHLRKVQKPVVLVVNKTDGIAEEQALSEFYALGIADVHPIAASQGRGVQKLLESSLQRFPPPATADIAGEKPDSIRICVAGRPNVGKSTLVNRMLGDDRVVVYDQAGTTRDSIYIPYERHGKHYTLIDTAGIRKRGKTTELVEKFSVVKSLQAIQDAHVVILLLDAREGIVEQDLHLLGYVIETGRALVIALNKWDGMDEYAKDKIREAIRRRFDFVDYAKIHFISALHGTGVGNLYDSVHKAYDSAFRKIPTSRLNQVLERVQAGHQPPTINGRRVKLRYIHLGGHNPPVLVIHGKQAEKLPSHYVRYLEKNFRKLLRLEGTPVRIELREDENPYTRDEQNLNYREVARKRRILKNREFLRAKK